jgi:thioester reductase-like protein/acyl-coenzyme A synthetase/AMP-(fatty) acid ligase/aryl carrier-like protein
MAFSGCFELPPTRTDRKATNDPDGIYAYLPVSTTYQGGFRPVTHLELATSVNFIANLITQNFGKGTIFETIAYIGPSDMRYAMVLLAIIKAGFKMFLPSPRNSKEAQVFLMEKLECTKLITTEPHIPGVALIEHNLSIEKLVIPSLDELLSLDSQTVQPMAYTKTLEEAKNDPIYVLHTSGSTGIPKPLVYTNETFRRMHNAFNVKAPIGYMFVFEKMKSRRFYTNFPGFHMGGVVLNVYVPLYLGAMPVHPLPNAPPTVDSLVQACRHANIEFAAVAPVVVDDLGNSPVLLEEISRKLQFIIYSGGPVPESSGNSVARIIPLFAVMGSSETAILPGIRPVEYESGEDIWQYLQFHKSSNITFQHRFGNYHEMVQVRKSSSSSVPTTDADGCQPVFCHFDIDEFQTKDLFVEHNQVKGFWKYVARLDDVIVFLNGEKTNPITFEQEVSQHPEVSSALVIGAGRIESALLIELKVQLDMSDEEKLQAIERIWPLVQICNEKCPRHAKVFKSKIIFTTSERPMARAGKGTVQRLATLHLYKVEIDNLYKDDAAPFPVIGSTASASTVPILHVVRLAVHEVVNAAPEDDADFFAIGMDSLQALQLRRVLQLKLPDTVINLQDIYANPSISRLSATISTQSVSKELSSAVKLVNNTLESCKRDIDVLLLAGVNEGLDKPIARAESQKTILLTGSTGALGSYILNDLLQSPVKHIYCLNRSIDSRSVQYQRNKSRNLPVELDSKRVTFLTGNLAAPEFGLEAIEFRELLASVTDIIHNAWPVNFNKSLNAFKGSLDTVLGLVSFSARATHSVRFNFISSISSVSHYTKADPVPENVIFDTDSPAEMGYGQSKYIAERMIDYASQKLNFHSAIIRVGQIAGDASRKNGWNRHEWFPSLIISSLYIGALPRTLSSHSLSEPIDWVPIDQVSKVVCELTFRESYGSPVKVFHVLHPRPTEWDDILKVAKAKLETIAKSKLEVVTYKDWVALLQSKSERIQLDAESVKDNPGMKLLDFYVGLMGEKQQAKLSTKETVQNSLTLNQALSLQNEWVEGWILDWLR